MSATKDMIVPETSSALDSAVVGGGMTQRERILLQPQDYIGSVEKCTRKIWVFEGRSMRHRFVTYVPGLYKIFDEILVYAADNKQRDPSMDSLNVEIDVAECRISIHYSGQGVPIERHPEDGVHMPEMIFGDLSNCEEIAGGRNSYGVKLANLFSTEFIIEIADSRREKKYKQVTY
jgi:DNA topoisomerase-2